MGKKVKKYKYKYICGKCGSILFSNKKTNKCDCGYKYSDGGK